MLTPQDPLGFVDAKKYRDRLKGTYKSSGLRDAFISGVGRHRRAAGVHRLASRSSSWAARWARSSARRWRASSTARYERRLPGDRLQLDRRRAHAGGHPLPHADGEDLGRARTASARCASPTSRCCSTRPPAASRRASPGSATSSSPSRRRSSASPARASSSRRSAQKLPPGFQRSEFLLEHGMIDAHRPAGTSCASRARRSSSAPPRLDPRGQRSPPPSGALRPATADSTPYLAGLQPLGDALRARARCERALDALGHPERAFAVLHVGGTNGKGSTCAMAAAALAAAGHEVGLYTSPHLVRFNERIAGATATPIADADARRGGRRDPPRLPVARRGREGDRLTYFEFATLAGLLHVRARRRRRRGARGRARRAASTRRTRSRPRVTAITRIGLDHTQLLGDTRRADRLREGRHLQAGRPGGRPRAAAAGRARDAPRRGAPAAGRRFVGRAAD